MNELDKRCLETFAGWLKSLADDSRTLSEAVQNEELSEGVRRPLAGALNYLFKSLDLIDDGIEGLGFLDDAFVLRIAAAKAGEGAPAEVRALGEDAGLLLEFLGELAPRLDRFVTGLEKSTVRGRSVDAILSEEGVRSELLGDLSAWASRYEKPAFAHDPKNLIQLKSFLGAKLPA